MVKHVSEALRVVAPTLAAKNSGMSGHGLFRKCESPIELAFAYEARDWLAQPLEPQVEVLTHHGRFRLDFLSGDVAFECDGERWHTDQLRDAVRDALVLSTGRVRAIYRLRGADLLYRNDDVLLWLAAKEPGLFRPVMHGWLTDAPDFNRILVTRRTAASASVRTLLTWVGDQPVRGLDALMSELRRQAA